METTPSIIEKEGSQFQPFSEESNLLNTDQPKTVVAEKKRMPSFKNLIEKWKEIEYPFNQLSRFY